MLNCAYRNNIKMPFNNREAFDTTNFHWYFRSVTAVKRKIFAGFNFFFFSRSVKKSSYEKCSRQKNVQKFTSPCRQDRLKGDRFFAQNSARTTNLCLNSARYSTKRLKSISSHETRLQRIMPKYTTRFIGAAGWRVFMGRFVIPLRLCSLRVLKGV